MSMIWYSLPLDLAIGARKQGGLFLGQKCNRIEALRQKHAAFDLEVQRLAHHPSHDSLSIAALKKEKLRLKEEIHSLEVSLALEAPATTSLSLAAE